MAMISVSDFTLFINNQIEAQEEIEAYLWQLQTLMTVAIMAENFYELSENILHNYFFTVNHLIKQAITINQKSLNELLKKWR